MSDLWAGIVCGFVLGASVTSLLWTFWTAHEVPRSKVHLTCRACGESFMGPHAHCKAKP